MDINSSILNGTVIHQTGAFNCAFAKSNVMCIIYNRQFIGWTLYGKVLPFLGIESQIQTQRVSHIKIAYYRDYILLFDMKTNNCAYLLCDFSWTCQPSCHAISLLSYLLRDTRCWWVVTGTDNFRFTYLEMFEEYARFVATPRMPLVITW